MVDVSDDKSLYAAYHTPPVTGQPNPEAPTDVPLVIPSPQLDCAKTCCPGCKDLDLSQVPLIPVEEPMRNPFDVNQGRAACHQGVRTGQRAHRTGRVDRPGYGGVACMQPLGGRRQEYPTRCEREQDRLGWFAKFGLTGEQSGDNASEDDTDHSECWQFAPRRPIGTSRVLNGRSIAPSLVVGSSDGTSG